MFRAGTYMGTMMGVRPDLKNGVIRLDVDVSIDQIVASLRGAEDSSLLSIMDRLADMVGDKHRVKDWAWTKARL